MRKVSLLLLLFLPALVFRVQAEGAVFLTVSEITFSTVGESENIYAGTAPAGEVAWFSEDETVVTVTDGVVTAVGTGRTTVRAEWNGDTVSCDAACLAEDRESLLKLRQEVLEKPGRIPPKTELDPGAYFGDAVLIGDSITYNMQVQETKSGQLGHPLFLARKNIGVHNFYSHRLNVYYQGREMYVEDAVAACGKRKVFFLLGMNDLGYQTPGEVAEKYSVIIDRVLANAPDAEIYIQSTLPAYHGLTHFSNRNAEIDALNGLLRQMCAEKGYTFVDLAPYLKNHTNGMASVYSSDADVHLTAEGSAVWMDVLRAFACMEEQK